jgi:hypothetical protein
MSVSNSQPHIVSPLTLSHTLLSLAEDADRAGLSRSAARLLRLAHTVCAERPRPMLAAE